MFLLHLLGGVSLEGPSGPLSGPAVQRHQLAMLALLAVAGEKGVSREKLAGCLWPESDSDRARHLLAHSVYVLRAALGADAILGSGDVLRLNAEIVQTDVGGFSAALAGGELELAARAYGGPFLDGFYLDDHRDFELWMESERQRLASEYASAVESLAEAAEQAGSQYKAAEWWNRLTLHDPYNSRFTVALMRALAAAGDPANALKRAIEHETLLREELDLELPESVRELAEELRKEPLRHGQPDPGAPVLHPPRLAPGAERSRQQGERRARARRLALVATASLFVVIVVAVASTALLRFLDSTRTPTLISKGVLQPRERIVFADFDNLTDDSTIAITAAQALRIDLYESPVVTIIEPSYLSAVLTRMERDPNEPIDEETAREVAAREGLKAVLVGDVHQAGSGYLFAARLVAAEDGEILWAARVTANDPAGVIPAIDSLSAALRAGIGESIRGIHGGRPLAQATTSSLEALTYYARAVEANDRRDYRETAELAEQAIETDSAFASAYRLASVAEFNLGRLDSGVERAIRAFDLRDGVTERERLYIEANYHIQARVDWRAAADVYRELVRLYPDEYVAHNNLGLAGRMLGDAEQSYQGFRRSIDLNPYPAAAFASTIAAAALTNRWEEADSLIRAAEQRGLGTQTTRSRRDLAAAMGDWERVDEACGEVLKDMSSPWQHARDQYWCGALGVARGRVREGLQRVQVAAQLFERAGVPAYQAMAVAEAARTEGVRNRPEAGRARLEVFLDNVAADSVGEPIRGFIRAYLRAVACELGQLDLAERIKAYYPPPDTSILVLLYDQRVADASEALAEGDAMGAISLLRDAQVIATGGAPLQYQALLVFAAAFDELAEVDSAIAYLERAAHLGYLSYTAAAAVRYPGLKRRLAELEEARGNRQAAIRHYEQLLELWSATDPELSGQVEALRQAVARLQGGPPG